MLPKMFLAGSPVEAGVASAALPSDLLDDLSAHGLIAREGGEVRATVRIVPLGGMLIAHDLEEGALARDHVVGVGLASTTLAALTVRRPGTRTLDVGTGCGVQALLASRHSDSVVGTDVSERALWFCAFNAALNDIENIELRRGDLLAPVAGEAFDLVVANPPFVMSPDTAYVFRDSGAARDAISQAVVEEAGTVLAEGGFACVLCNWIVDDGDDWSTAPRRWVADSDCDAWLLHYRTDDPLGYAAMWNESLRAADPQAYEATVGRWLEYYEREGIDAIALGAVVMRRRAGDNWIRADEMPLAPTGLASDHILRVFRNQDLLATGGGRWLLETPLLLAEDHRFDQTLLHRDGHYRPQPGRLVLENGVGVEGPVPPEAVHLLFRLDGQAPLHEVFEELAQDLGRDAESLSNESMPAVRRLVELGFVEPAGAAGA